MSADGLLRVSNLSITYTSRRSTVEAVRNVSFDVGRGEIVALVGESGSGKTTIARAVMGMLPEVAQVTGGAVFFDGDNLIGRSEQAYDKVRGRRLGWIPQDPMVALNPLHRIGRQVAEPLLIHRLASRGEAARQAVALLERVGIARPELRAEQYPHELSGGMRQRVLIAGALAAEPQLIIADEPTTALDVTVQKRILDDIENLTRSNGIAVLIITHDLAMAAERADRVVVLRSGSVVEQGSARAVLESPREAYTKLLLASVPGLSGRRRRPSAVLAAPSPGEREPLLRLRNVSKSFTLASRGGASHALKAVSGASLSIRPGETFGLVGESGSGKSTLARIVLGLVAPSSGSVSFRGRDIATLDRNARREHRKLVQPIYQNPYASLNPRLSIGEIIGEPLEGFRLGDRAWRRRRVAQLLDQVQLPSALGERMSSELSGGQRQRVAIARALAAEPQLIICDEPVSALDVSVQAQILDLLAELQATHRLSYLFISHDLAVVRQVSDHVGVMKDGEIVEQGPADEIYRAPRHAYTRLLLDSIPGRVERAA